MRTLVIGGAGQLARALVKTAPEDAQCLAPSRAECDLTNLDQIKYWLDEHRADTVMNAAAYTAVDAAEADSEAAELVNARSVEALAKFTKSRNLRLVHVSTDFVFDGNSSKPYAPDDATNPLGAYGRSKLHGETAVLQSDPQALIVRTSWVYAAQGKNFLKTMLRLLDERAEVRVVSDQIGTPTFAPNLARTLWRLAKLNAHGIYHYSDAGVASWYDFAVAIQEEALSAGLLKKKAAIIPIATEYYPTPARRPRFSVLEKSKTFAATDHVPQHWREALRDAMKELNSNA